MMPTRPLAWRLTVILYVSLLRFVPLGAQERKLTFADLDEAYVLDRMVDAVADGKLAGGDAWLKWDHHAFRADDGLTYLPFTVVIDEAPGAFRSVAMYVRVANRGEGSSAGRERAARSGYIGFDRGEVPVFVPERATSASSPDLYLAGEASTALRLAQDTLDKVSQDRYPFEDLYFFDFVADEATEPYQVRRALAVASGEYDVYIAVREYSRSGSQPSDPKAAVFKRQLTVPDFPRTGLSMSSVIVADDVRTLPAPLSDVEQSVRPYVFGLAEVVPVSNALLSSADSLSVVFFVYNAAADADNKPNLTVRYRFHQNTNVSEQFFRQTAPMEFNASTLPEQFDFDAVGHQLAVSQAVPLESFPESGYRLEIVVTDNIASQTVVRNLPFVVRAGSEN